MNSPPAAAPSGLSPAGHRYPVAYRPDIDGLRGIAVIAVVLYHAFPSVVPSGYVGVDVFFVISGFLITSIIVGDLEQGRFGFWRFYANRIRRIFPALLVVLACTLVLGMGLLLGDEFQRLSRHLAGAAAFVSNFLLWQESGYFDAEVEAKPLLHLWSLAIEEQFYLAWPLVLWLTWRRRLVFWAVLILGFSWSVHQNLTGISRDAAGAFYSPATRAWELALGASLAAASRLHLERWRCAEPWATLAACLALAAIAFASFGISRGAPYPGWWALVPTFATAALIALPATTALHRHVLGSRPLVGVGLISYPLYLWHWPLLSFTHISGHDSNERRIVLVGASALLAYLTYRLIERPIRFGATFRRRKALGLLAGMAMIGVAGLLGVRGELSPSFGGDNLKDYQEETKWTYITAPQFKPVAFGDNDFPGAAKLRADLAAYSPSGILFFREIASARPNKTLYIGDSQMEQFWPRIGQLIQDDPAKTRSAVFLTASAFLPIPGVHFEPEAANPHFSGLASTMLAYALSDPMIDTVVVGASWRGHFRDGDIRNRAREDSPFYVVIDGRQEHLKAGRRANEVALSHLGRMIQALRAAGKRVFVLLDVPANAEVTMRRTWGRYELAPPPETKEESLRRNANIRAELSRVATRSGAEVIDPYAWLCPGDRCQTLYEGHHPVYMNASHLADRFVRRHAAFMDPTLEMPTPPGELQ